MPGYYNNEGKAGNPDGFFTTSYGAGPIRFHHFMSGGMMGGSKVQKSRSYR